MANETNDIKEIFLAAAELPTSQRASYLDEVLGDKPDVRRRVEALLNFHDVPGDFTAVYAPVAGQSDSGPEIGACIGPYRLLQQIGEGGMGTVFLAEQTQPVQRQVALKIIKAGMDSRQVIGRFEAERQALAMMDHINIARVLDAGTTDEGRPYFVMEMVHGVAITKYCDDNHLTPRDRIELIVPVCQAIQHAHQKGIIHRDIKPSNVLVAVHEGRAVPKVIDFGVAKAIEQRPTERTLFTQYGMMVGTLEYMSPEQADMNATGVDTRSDIFSLGVLLYELMTGSTPISAQRLKDAGFAEVLRLIKEEEPPKPSTRLSGSGTALAAISAQRHMEPVKLTKLLRGELDWIVMKCLEKDRNRRYATANGLAADLRRYLNDEAVEACPPSRGYRIGKFIRRNQGAVWAASVVILSLIGGVVGATAGMVRAQNAEQVARLAKERAERERDAAIEARQETFEALFEVTEFADKHLFFDQRVSGPEEKAFRRRMADRYERLAANVTDVAESHDLRARSLSQLGQNYIQQGDEVRGIDAWRRAADVYRNLPSAKSAETEEARQEMRTHARRFRSVALTAEKLRRWHDATEFARRQIQFAQAAIIPGQRVDQELFNLLLTAHWTLTISLTATNQFAEAKSVWEEMTRLVAWSEPGVINYSACDQLSLIFGKLNAVETVVDPAEVLTPGVIERQAKLAANSNEKEARVDLRRAYRVTGLIYEKSRRYADALAAYDKVLAVGPNSFDENTPQNNGERELISGSLIGRAVCLDALGRENDADAAWDVVYEFSATTADHWLDNRALHMAWNGQFVRAARLVDDICVRPGNHHLYNAACVLAMSTGDGALSSDQREEIAHRAIKLLERAFAAGFFDRPEQIAHAKTDKFLDALRGRSDFQQFSAKIGSSTKAGKN